MNTTSVTLLERLRSTKDDSAWRRFAELYTPMLLAWSRRAGLTLADAEDLTQEVLVVLTEELPRFQYDPGRSFRAWLRTVSVNKCRELQRRRQVTATPGGDGSVLDAIEAPDQLDLVIEREYTSELLRRAFRLLESEFDPQTIRACRECIENGWKSADVAQELGMPVAAVFTARSRVLRRLRKELDGLLD